MNDSRKNTFVLFIDIIFSFHSYDILGNEIGRTGFIYRLVIHS